MRELWLSAKNDKRKRPQLYGFEFKMTKKLGYILLHPFLILLLYSLTHVSNYIRLKKMGTNFPAYRKEKPPHILLWKDSRKTCQKDENNKIIISEIFFKDWKIWANASSKGKKSLLKVKITCYLLLERRILTSNNSFFESNNTFFKR